MDISVSSRHIEVPENIREYVLDKFGKIDRFYQGVQRIEVILKNEDRKKHCEVIIHTRMNNTPVIDATGDELVEAIDIAVDKAERQLRRLKEKATSHRRRAVNPADVEPATE